VTALDFAAPLLEAGRVIAERGHHLEEIVWRNRRGAERLVASLPVERCEHVIDVGCGTGFASVIDPALRPFAEVMAAAVRLAQLPGPLKEWELAERQQARWADDDAEWEAMRDTEAEGELFAFDDEGGPVEMYDE
jgi:hypothetical protein